MYRIGLGVDKNDSTATTWYHEAAEKGYATAQNNFGMMYEYGNGVDKKNSTAAEWYHKAAE